MSDPARRFSFNFISKGGPKDKKQKSNNVEILKENIEGEIPIATPQTHKGVGTDIMDTALMVTKDEVAKAQEETAVEAIAKVPELPEVKIAVMGTTGSGKTTFINLLSGSDLLVGENLASCTSDVQFSHQFDFEGRKVTLVDTPGFDDTLKSDSQVFEIICQWLVTEYQKGERLHGVIYLHRITDNRMAGSALRNFQFFRELCGEHALKNSNIVTNMWNVIPDDRKVVAEAREEELKTGDMFFGPVLSKGARLFRHDNTIEAGQKILRSIIGNSNPVPLAIQKELVDDKKTVVETKAGDVLLGEFAELERKHREEMKELMEQLEEAKKEKDEDGVEELEEARKELEAERAFVQDKKKKFIRSSIQLSNSSSWPVSPTVPQLSSNTSAGTPLLTRLSEVQPASPPLAGISSVIVSEPETINLTSENTVSSPPNVKELNVHSTSTTLQSSSSPDKLFGLQEKRIAPGIRAWIANFILKFSNGPRSNKALDQYGDISPQSNPKDNGVTRRPTVRPKFGKSLIPPILSTSSKNAAPEPTTSTI
ncbi:P-loop containing nucleoside triphosphate hydrolase protein [Abortiporus biennis]|nr:P-loop containing nucleoside triphosphate hydrolase protein [Abortiporus biennis]